MMIAPLMVLSKVRRMKSKVIVSAKYPNSVPTPGSTFKPVGPSTDVNPEKSESQFRRGSNSKLRRSGPSRPVISRSPGSFQNRREEGQCYENWDEVLERSPLYTYQ